MNNRITLMDEDSNHFELSEEGGTRKSMDATPGNDVSFNIVQMMASEEVKTGLQ